MNRLLTVVTICSIFIKSWGASAPSDVVTYSTIYKFPNALPGSEIQVTKTCNVKTGTCDFSSNSSRVRSTSDLVNLERAEAMAIRDKFGALTGSAISSFQNLKTDELLKVNVALKEPDGIKYLDKTKNSQEDLLQQPHTISQIQPVVSIDEFLFKHGLKIKNKMSRNVFRMDASRKEIESIMFDKDVASIDEYGEESSTSYTIPDDITNLAPSAYWHSTSAVPSTAGSGVNAATLERGIDTQVYNCFNSLGNLSTSRLDMHTYTLAGNEDYQHSQWTFHCLIKAAPGANLWHRDTPYYYFTSDSTDSVYINNNNIQTISMSKERGRRVAYPANYTEFLYMDDRAYYSPWPVFVNPAANDGYKYVSNWQCYNAINVGNVLHDNLTHFILPDTNIDTGGCTQTKNPTAVYGSSNDRELPHLVAPGFAHHDYCVDNASINFTCGTSLSAPVVNGIAADVIAADTRMAGWPEKVRAVLLATAQNVDRGDWSYLSDGRDGAGVVHGANAVSFAQNHTSVSPNGTAVRDGMGAGSINHSDFVNPTSVYKVLIPNPKPSGRHLRVVLTWDSNPVFNTATNALSDLDLMVTSGSQGMVSQSNNSNVEIVDIPNTMFTAGWLCL